MIESTRDALLPSSYGSFKVRAYRDGSGGEHLAIYKGLLDGGSVPVRIHSECLTGDTIRSLKCDCGEQLELALRRIEKEGRGAVVYLRQEGRGIGLFNKIKAYALQEEGKDTVEANNILGFPDDMRDYKVAADILKDLGVKSVVLLTNNKNKIAGLRKSGIKVEGRIPLTTEPNEHNSRYLKTKRDKLDHML
jgi:3,4-dihydroxy 2-butanone 4-phosphate synthase/GTP cyclohydrolase II